MHGSHGMIHDFTAPVNCTPWCMYRASGELQICCQLSTIELRCPRRGHVTILSYDNGVIDTAFIRSCMICSAYIAHIGAQYQQELNLPLRRPGCMIDRNKKYWKSIGYNRINSTTTLISFFFTISIILINNSSSLMPQHCTMML